VERKFKIKDEASLCLGCLFMGVLFFSLIYPHFSNFPAKWGKSRLGTWENVVGIKQKKIEIDLMEALAFLSLPQREEKKEKILKAPSPCFNCGRMRGIRVYLIKSILFVFVNFGVFNV